MAKGNMITKIVRLRQVVQRWKDKSLRRRSVYHSDSDESAGMECRTPSGSLGLYVGPNRIRFVIPTRFLNFPVFVALLHQAEEEFGFQTTGGLVLPCEPEFFEEIVRLLEKDEKEFRGLGLDEFLNIISGVGLEPLEQVSCKECSSYSLTPLLSKTRV